MHQPVEGLKQETGAAKGNFRLSQEQQKKLEKAIKRGVYINLYHRQILCDEQFNHLMNQSNTHPGR